MNHLRKLGLASFLFLFLGLLRGALPQSATGWRADTAHRAQSLDGTTKFLA